MSLRSVSRKAGGVVLVAAGVGLGFWLSLVLADVLTFVWVYSSVDNMMEDYGFSEYLGKLIAVAFAALVGYFTHTVLLKVIKRDKKWVPMVAGVMAVWFVVMYLVSSPYTSGLFNPFSGQARAVYLRMPDGTIKSFPKGLKFDPDTGRRLEKFTPATAEEYQKQQGAKKKTSLLWKTPADSNQVTSTVRGDNLELWVEKIQVAPDRTIIHLACEGRNGKAATLRPVSNVYNFLWKGQGYDITIRGTYLADDSGQTYDPSASSAVYDSTETSYGWGPWENFHPTRYVRVDEIYRFTLTFPPLRQGTFQLRLHLAYLEPALDLDSALAKAEKIPPIVQVQPPGPVEATLESQDPVVPPSQPSKRQ